MKKVVVNCKNITSFNISVRFSGRESRLRAISTLSIYILVSFSVGGRRRRGHLTPCPSYHSLQQCWKSSDSVFTIKSVSSVQQCRKSSDSVFTIKSVSLVMQEVVGQCIYHQISQLSSVGSRRIVYLHQVNMSAGFRRKESQRTTKFGRKQTIFKNITGIAHCESSYYHVKFKSVLMSCN